MPPVLSRPSGAAPASLFYITVGALMTVWCGIWFWYLRDHSETTHSISYYLCAGFLFTGLVLLAIGFTLGPLSRLARHAELPPSEVTGNAVRAEENATSRRV